MHLFMMLKWKELKITIPFTSVPYIPKADLRYVEYVLLSYAVV